MFRHALALVVAIAAFTFPAYGDMPLEDVRAMERRAASDPKKAIAEGRASLAAAEAAGNKVARLAALRLIALSHDALDDNPGLRDTARIGLALARELGDRPAQVEFITQTALSLFNEGRMPESIREHDSAIALAQEHSLDRELAKAYVAKAHTLIGQERSSEAMEYLLKAHALLEKLGEKLLLSSTLSAVGNSLTKEDATPEQLKRAVGFHQRAMALVDPSNKYELSTIYYNLGVAHAYLKDYAEAYKVLEKCLAIGRELNDPHTVAFVNYRLGSIDLARGNADKALVRFEAALPGFRAAENIQLEFVSQVGRARSLAYLLRRRDSLTALEAAKELAAKLNSPGRDVLYYDVAAEVHAKLGEWDEAYKALRLLRDADQRVAAAGNQKLTQELQARFGSRQRETENELLRMEGKVQEARWWLLLLALGLAAIVVAGLVLYVVRQGRQNRRFAALAMRDDLTGLPNRRSILEFARSQFHGRRSGDAGFVLALIDIDHFKSINDQLGHSVGDEVLKAFAQAGLKALRGEDRIGRFGGEEFVVVMPNLDISGAPVVFERLRKAVHGLKAPGWPEDRALTFSMGATAARDSDPDLDWTIKRADEALYRAKNNGRDRLEVG